MEVVIGLGCVIILLIVLGVPVQPMIALALSVMGGNITIRFPQTLFWKNGFIIKKK